MEADSDWQDDERAIELQSIAAIFPELVVDSECPFKASLSLPVSPTDPSTLIFEEKRASLPTSADVSNAQSTEGVQSYSISHFPPLLLEIELPEQYPAIRPPKFALSTQPAWLEGSIISKLQAEGRQLWEDSGKDLVLYSYIDLLQQKAESIFGLLPTPDSILYFPDNLKVPLLALDLKLKREKFEQETFVCGICLEPKKGQSCHQLQRCSHVFCISCLQDFYTSCIKEGDVDNVRCTDPSCVKDSAAALMNVQNAQQAKRHRRPDFSLTPTELLQIPLESQIVERYALLKRKHRLEADKSIIYCPRQWCQGAARSKRFPKPTDPMNLSNMELSDDEDEVEGFDPLGEEDQLPPMEKRLAICEDCSYAFCRVCKKGWHGPGVYCFPRRAADITKDEKATEDYMQLYTTRCPTCEFRCQKAMGCNHMICSRCKTHFCYLCSSWLFAGNPYQHFNERKSTCYMRLWELETGDGIVLPGEEQNPHPVFVAGPEENEVAQVMLDNQPAAVPVPNDHHPPAPRAIPPAPQQRAEPRIEIVLPHRQPRVIPNGVEPAQGHGQPPRQPGAQQRPAQEPGQRPDQQRGLQRFLYLVQRDQEDEWDSDELDEDF